MLRKKRKANQSFCTLTSKVENKTPFLTLEQQLTSSQGSLRSISFIFLFNLFLLMLIKQFFLQSNLISTLYSK